jgi:hypothetical protein
MTYPNGFLYRKPILAGSSRPSSDLTSFSKLFIISSDSDIDARCSSQKFQFTEADGTTTAPYGGLYFDASGNLKARAKFATWPASATAGVTVLGYLYYGDAGTDQSNKAGAIDSNTKIYMPLEDTPTGSAGDIENWLGSSNGSSNGSMGSNSITGQVNKGLSFNGSSQYIQSSATALNSASAFTLSFIAKRSAYASTKPAICMDSSSGFNTTTLVFYPYDDNGGNGARIYWNFTGVIDINSGAPSANAWNHFAFVSRSTSDQELYVNGSSVGTGASGVTLPSTFDKFQIGAASAASQYGDNDVDEVFLASTNRAAAWIAYEYTDAFDNGNTFSLGAEETDSAGPVIPVFMHHYMQQGVA